MAKAGAIQKTLSTMEQFDIPAELDGAKVMQAAPLQGVPASLGAAVLMNGGAIDHPAFLAMCQYRGETDYYLFYCSGEWSVLGAGRFETLEAALSSAQSHYPGVDHKWVIGA